MSRAKAKPSLRMIERRVVDILSALKRIGDHAEARDTLSEKQTAKILDTLRKGVDRLEGRLTMISETAASTFRLVDDGVIGTENDDA